MMSTAVFFLFTTTSIFHTAEILLDFGRGDCTVGVTIHHVLFSTGYPVWFMTFFQFGILHDLNSYFFPRKISHLQLPFLLSAIQFQYNLAIFMYTLLHICISVSSQSQKQAVLEEALRYSEFFFLHFGLSGSLHSLKGQHF